MISSKKSLLFLVCLLAGFVSNNARVSADSANDIFRECSAKLLHIVQSCEAKMMINAEICGERIEALVADGDVQSALSIARKCFVSFHGIANSCIAEIEILRADCEAQLLAADAPAEMILHFNVKAEVANGIIKETLRDAIDILVEALYENGNGGK